MAHPLLPLVLLILFLAVFAVIGYIAYSIAQDIASKTAKKMEDKNIRLSKDGVRVGVKQKDGQQEDAALQSLLVKAWSYSSWPAYKSRFWNKQPQEAPASRKSSTAQFDRRTSAQAERKGSAAGIDGATQQTHGGSRNASTLMLHSGLFNVQSCADRLGIQGSTLGRLFAYGDRDWNPAVVVNKLYADMKTGGQSISG